MLQRLRRFLPGACLTFLLALPAAGQETLSSVQRELDRVEREIAREKELHTAERKRAEAFEQGKDEKMTALNRQLAITQAKIDSLKREIGRAAGGKTAHKNRIALFERKRKEFRDTLAARGRALAEYFRRDFPYGNHRRAAEMEALAQALNAGSAGAEEGLFRMFGVLEEATDFAGGSEVYSGVYQSAQGRSLDGKFVRLGAVFLGFVSQDGKTAAYLTPTDTGYVWREADVSMEQHRNIVTAMNVAEGKAAPELVILPFRVQGDEAGSRPEAGDGEASAGQGGEAPSGGAAAGSGKAAARESGNGKKAAGGSAQAAPAPEGGKGGRQ